MTATYPLNESNDKQLDYWTGYMCIAIGQGKFRDAVAEMKMCYQKEAYERGLQAAKNGTPTHIVAFDGLNQQSAQDQTEFWANTLTASIAKERLRDELAVFKNYYQYEAYSRGVNDGQPTVKHDTGLSL